MTPAAIALAVLCGVLGVALDKARKRIMKELNEHVAHLDETIAMQSDWLKIKKGLESRINADSALIAEAHALLHDERHKGKLDNQKQWQAARAEWAGKVNAR
jgi:hypothetical protein